MKVKAVLATFLSATLAVGAFAPALSAAAYPDRPVRLVVPYPPGGTTDVIGRMVAQELSNQTGQPVIVDNKPGAGGNIGAENVASAQPDGYTLLLAASGILAINPTLFKNLSFDLKTSFAPVANVVVVPNILVANPTGPHKLDTFEDFLAVGKREKPDTLNLGSNGNGSLMHLMGAVLSKETGISMMHVPYKGSAPMLQALYGNEIDLSFDNVPTSLPHINSGRIHGLMVTGEKRHELLPDIPTATELGYPALDMPAWFGVVAPAGTDPEIVQFLNEKINAGIANEAFQEKLKAMGMQPARTTAEEFHELIVNTESKWGAIVREVGATVD